MERAGIDINWFVEHPLVRSSTEALFHDVRRVTCKREGNNIVGRNTFLNEEFRAECQRKRLSGASSGDDLVVFAEFDDSFLLPVIEFILAAVVLLDIEKVAVLLKEALGTFFIVVSATVRTAGERIDDSFEKRPHL